MIDVNQDYPGRSLPVPCMWCHLLLHAQAREEAELAFGTAQKDTKTARSGPRSCMMVLMLLLSIMP